jgi:hypothetical protein
VALVVVDVPTSERAAAERFWSGLTQRTARSGTRYPEFSVLEPIGHVGVLIQAIDGDARYHLDIHTDDLEAECRRVQLLGAVEVDRRDNWVVFHTPGGPLACVVGVPSDDPSLDGAIDVA